MQASTTEPWFLTSEKVKMDLFLRFGVIAAAGDRHLAEFCPGKWYLESPEQVKAMGYGLTPVSWRKENLGVRLARSERLKNGEEELKVSVTGEEGTHQMRALLGLSTMVTNINIPNYGQISNLPLGTIVETNAGLKDDSVTPVMAGEVPPEIYYLVRRISDEFDEMVDAALNRDLDAAYEAFRKGHLVTSLTEEEKKDLFEEMYENTKAYLADYTRK
jgi:alpha-galactosidase